VKNTATHLKIIPSPLFKGRVSILIPCFNEESIIINTINQVRDYLSHLQSISSWEIILINDGSTDDTLKLLESFQTESIRVLSFDRNKGRGAAVRAGMQAATGEFIIPLDADLSYDLNHIQQIFDVFVHKPKTDVVIVSAYMKGGTVQGVPVSRLLLSRIANWILSRFFPQKLSTVTCVVRGYRKEVIQNLCLLEKGKEFHLEILKKLFLNGANIQEIPGRLVWKREKKGTSSTRGLNIFKSSQKHLLYVLAIKPYGFFKYITLFLLLIGTYESVIFISQVIKALNLQEAFTPSLWLALKTTFDHSPHTFFIALGTLTLGLNTFSFLLIIHILRINHEENLRHLLAVLENKSLLGKE
jgi:glycosyltransferase involved in cell wall biosynthesis